MMMNYNPMSPEVRVDPYPYYKWLRNNAPVYFIEAMNCYAISCYEDVRYVLKNHQLFSSDPLIKIAFGEFNPVPGAPYLISSDPPDHTRLRRALGAAFSMKIVESMTERIAGLARELLDTALVSDHLDFVPAFTSPLPVTVIAELMGIDSEMRGAFRRWSNEITVGSDSNISEETRTTIRASAVEFRAYFEGAIAARRKAPGSDLVSALIRAQDEAWQLTDDEVLAFCLLLLIGGNETTTSTLGNTLYLLSQFPDQKRKILADRSLVPNLIEESLRYISPIQLLFRRTRQPVEIGGVSIPENTIVMPIYASANRDDARFPDGDSFDVTRDTRDHMAFGHGAHHCMGALLGRHEAVISMNLLLDRMADFEVDLEGVQWLDSFYLRGPKVLPMTRLRSAAAA
jgi:cytochrome P450